MGHLIRTYQQIVGVLLVVAVASDASASASPCINDADEHWWDSAHRQVSAVVCWPSRWFDGFFDRGDSNDSEAGTTLRIRQGMTWRDNDDNSTPLHLHTHVVLPHFKQRLRLIFVNDDEAEDDRQRIVSPNKQRDDDASSGFRTALRWMLIQTRNSGIDIDVGLRSGLKPYTRVRHQWRQVIGEKSLIKITQKLTYRQTQGASYEPSWEFSYQLSNNRSIATGVDAEISEKTIDRGDGWIVSPWVSLYQRLNEKSALRYGIGMNAVTRPAWESQLYRASVLYRRNILRKWLFYEVEPFLEWPKSQDFGTVTGISLRLEVFLGYLRQEKDYL